MARKLREKIIAPEKMYHIVCRGINQKRIFRGARDYKKMLAIIKKAKRCIIFICIPIIYYQIIFIYRNERGFCF